MGDGRLVLAWGLRSEGRGLVSRGERPGASWHGHGYTTKRVVALHSGRLVVCEVHKQRWRDTATGATVHDRPARDVSWARYGLLVVFGATWSWMSGPRGLHHVVWAWPDERPSPRTVQRWMRRLLAEALAWQVAIRDVVADHLAPATLEEAFPAGLPPPGTVARWRSAAAPACQLTRGLALLNESAPLGTIPADRLLVESHVRFREAQPRRGPSHGLSRRG